MKQTEKVASRDVLSIIAVKIDGKIIIAKLLPALQIPIARPLRFMNQRFIIMETGIIEPRP